VTDAIPNDPRAAETPVVLERIDRASAPVLGQLLELYAHDFSEFVPLAPKESGRFDLPFYAWWEKADHFPFFIRHRDRLAGFALVRRGSRVTASSDVMDVAEFFVLRGARRLGVGSRAAHAVFRLFPGPWEVRVRKANGPALAFWTRVVERWHERAATSGSFSSDGVDWNVFRIEPSGG
jgi:predicted acetyltransferase